MDVKEVQNRIRQMEAVRVEMERLGNAITEFEREARNQDEWVEGGKHRYYNLNKQMAQVKRASMDLTRSLPQLRKSNYDA